MLNLDIQDPTLLASNSQWQFCIGRLEQRWIGYAFAPAHHFADIMPEISLDGQLGHPDRDHAVKLTTAIAQDPEHAYGEITDWFVSLDQRGHPDSFRCHHCERVACDGTDCTNVLDLEALIP
jgi:hypothetical protein